MCGTEPVLRDFIVEKALEHFADSPWSRVFYWANTDDSDEIWAELDQFPLDGEPRIVVVRYAEKLSDLHRLKDWVASRTKNPLTHVLFVSSEPELSREEPTKEMLKERKKPALLPHLAAIYGKGSLVECKPFTQATAKHAVKWVQSMVPIRPGTAGKLLERANGDLRLTMSTVRKLAAFPEEITEQSINLLLSARPRMSFHDALLTLDKPAAMLALDYLQPDQYSAEIGLLDQRLEVLGVVRDMVLMHKNRGEIAKALGPMGFMASEFMAVSKMYDKRRRDAARALLAKTDAALKAGQTRGPMQALAVLW